MGVSRGLLLILLMALPAVVNAAAALVLQAEPAWHGTLKAGAGSELLLTLQAPYNGTLEIRLPDHRPRLQFRAELQAYRPLQLPVAVHPDPTRPLRVEAFLEDDTNAATEVRFLVVPADTRLVATTLALPAGTDLQTQILQSTPQQLPRTPEGYAGIDRLLLDTTSLDALDERQWTSLQDYLARCGPLLLVGQETAPLAELYRAAGCNGRSLTLVPTLDKALTLLQTQPERPVADLPTAQRLQDLLPQTGDARWSQLLLFFGLYTLTLLLFARGSHSRLLTLPLLAALLAWLAWSNDTADRQLVSWSELQSGDHSLHYAALLQITGAGQGHSRTPLPADLGLLQEQGADNRAELHQTLNGPTLLIAPNHLLAQHSFYSRGSLPWTAPLQLTLGAQGPVVENRSTHASPPALLGWDGRRSPVPVLQPGERWTPPPEDTAWQVAHAEEQLLRSRTQTGTAALLLPHRLLPDTGVQAEIEEQGWLLITQG